MNLAIGWINVAFAYAYVAILDPHPHHSRATITDGLDHGHYGHRNFTHLVPSCLTE